MNDPFVIKNSSFQQTWVNAVEHLSVNNWKYFNLIIQITDPCIFDITTHNSITQFSKMINIRTPKDVAYTIFPYNQYNGNADELYQQYIKRFFPWTRKQQHSGWGTYFERMINYDPGNGSKRINQLKNIVDAINVRKMTLSAAYTISITHPGGETIRRMGGPCLNYLTIQMEPSNPPKLGILAIYRNHEFLERAYGNYFGLCKLLEFLNEQTSTVPGTITCVSSHAYVKGEKVRLKSFINSL